MHYTSKAFLEWAAGYEHFSRLEGLMQVSGIGPLTFQQIQGLISVY